MTVEGTRSPHEGAPNELRHPAALLDALRIIDRLRDRARTVGSTIPLAQLLRAQSLIIGLHREGVRLRGIDMTGLLTALLATSRESQARLGSAIVEIAEPSKPVSPGTLAVARAALRRRVLIVAVLLVALVAVICAAVFLVDMATHPAENLTPPDPDDRSDGSDGSQRELAIQFLGQTLIPFFYVMVPVIGAIAWLLRPQPGVRSALKRMTDTGRRVESIALLPVDTGVLRGPAMRRLMSDLRRPALISGDRLDTRATIRATIRNGSPTMRWRRKARVREYVLLCERGSAADHMVLMADAIAARLEGANVPFTRYDFGLGYDVVRHAGGRRSGPRSDAINAVCRRHAGARLIILGSGESLSRRFDGTGGASAFSDLLDTFSNPLMLNVSPQERWGWREAQLQEAGLALFTADESGIAQAVPWFADAETDAVTARTRIEPGEDPLLALLNRDAIRFASNIAPPDEEVARLVRRLRAYFRDVGGLSLLSTIAAFPQIDPAITARIVLLATGKPLSTRLAGRLASLPWLRSGRMPDWLIIALLRGLPEDERDTVRGTLLLLLDDLRAAQQNEATDALARAARLDILMRNGVARQLLARAGLAEDLIVGESIFVRFLEGAPLDELDQPDMLRAQPPSAARIAAAGGLFVIGVVLAGMMPEFWRWVGSIPGHTENLSYVALALLGFVLPMWHVQSIMLENPKPSTTRLAWLFHTAAYATMPYSLSGGGGEVILFGPVFLTFTALYIAVSVVPITQTRLADDAFPLWRIRAGIIAVTLTIPGFGQYSSGSFDTFGIGALLIAPLSIFAIQRTLWEQPEKPTAIIEMFPRQVLLSLIGALTVMALFLLLFGVLDYVSGFNILLERDLVLEGYLTVTYFFFAIRFDRRFLRPAIFTAFGLVALELTVSSSSAPFYGTLGVGAIGIASAFLLGRTKPTWSLKFTVPSVLSLRQVAMRARRKK